MNNVVPLNELCEIFPVAKGFPLTANRQEINMEIPAIILVLAIMRLLQVS